MHTNDRKDHWKKINTESVSELIDVEDLAADSKALLGAEMWPETFIEELAANGKYADAIKVLSHALPAREAVWWSCMCATQMEGLEDDKLEQSALQAAEKWVFKPNDEHRVDAFRHAQSGGSGSVGTLCALAAAFSEDPLPIGEHKIDVDTSKVP